MKRANSSENDRELDDSLDLHPQSDDNFENELLFKKTKSDLATNTVDEDEQQCSFQSKEVSKLCDSVTTVSDNRKKISESQCEDGKLNVVLIC